MEHVDPSLQEKLARKQKERKETLERYKSDFVLSEDKAAIVALSFEDLVAKLQAGHLSATRVLEAYIAKALQVNDMFNCITDFIPKAQEWARKLDELESCCRGPLHGLPVGIKEDHHIEGMDTSSGLCRKLYSPIKETATIVEILVALGAVPFVKTNLPQSGFAPAGENPVFGTTLNSVNVKLSPGGSSAGSACLVAAGGAPFATGTDLAGSLRIPAHFHGIASLTPTAGRLSGKGIVRCLPKLVGLGVVPGIIAPDVKSLATIWRALVSNTIQNDYDSLAVPIPWNENLFCSQRRLRFGYFTSLPFFPAFPDTKKSVEMAKDVLISQGHEVIPFEMPDSFNYMRVFMDLCFADHGHHLKILFKGEPVADCVAPLVHQVRNFGLQDEQLLRGSKRLAHLSQCGVSLKTPNDLWDVAYEKKVIRRQILNRMERENIELILSPAYPHPAIPTKDSYGLGAVVYTMIWNLVNFPSGVVPFGREAGGGVEDYDDEDDSMLQGVKSVMSESIGMPISVQVIGKPFKEELVLRALTQLHSLHQNSIQQNSSNS